MHFLIALIIPFLSFFLQSYPRFFNKYFGIDVWTRLIEIDSVRTAGHKVPGKITKGFIIDGFFDYPIIFPWIFSFFPKKFLFQYQGFIAPFFDSLQNIFVFFIAQWALGSIQAGLIAQLIYSLIPFIPIENSYLTPRSLGYFVFTLAFLPLVSFHVHQNVYLLVLSIVFTVILFLTHRFALQSFVFLSLFFSFFDKSLAYILVLFLSFVITIIITKGYYLRVLKGHLANIYFWVLNTNYRFAHQVFGNKKRKKADWVANIYSLLSVFSPIFLIGIDVWILFTFIFLYLAYASVIPQNLLLFKMSIWVIFFYIFGSFVLKIKKLIPIGEGQRYLEMCSVPTSIIATYVFLFFYNVTKIPTIGLFLLLAFYNLGIIIFVQIKGIISDKNRSLTTDLIKTYSFINKLPKTPRIMCIPHGITTMTVYNTKAQVLVNADNPGLLKITAFFPIIKRPLKEILKQFHISHILLQENFAKIEDLHTKHIRTLYRSGDIVLLEVKN